MRPLLSPFPKQDTTGRIQDEIHRQESYVSFGTIHYISRGILNQTWPRRYSCKKEKAVIFSSNSESQLVAAPKETKSFCRIWNVLGQRILSKYSMPWVTSNLRCARVNNRASRKTRSVRLRNRHDVVYGDLRDTPLSSAWICSIYRCSDCFLPN